MKQNKYVLQYTKIIEAKTNLIDTLNFISNIQDKSFKYHNFGKSVTFDMEKKIKICLMLLKEFLHL